MTREQIEELRDVYDRMVNPKRHLGDIDAGGMFAMAVPALLAAAERALLLEKLVNRWRDDFGAAVSEGCGCAKCELILAIDRAEGK